MIRLARNIFFLYYDGFKNLTIGKTLWKIIIIKLVIMFGVFKLFLFDENLDTRFSTDEQRSQYVLDNLTKDAK
ncbi:MAG: DUF4492 domain-containing protein [Campylobacterales bacterium]